MIRNSLQILETYKTLIYFPQNVDKYLKNDDYEQIISGFKLAHTQMSKAEPNTRNSRLFKQFKADLDTKLAKVQKHILEKLIQFPSSPDDQKFLIDYYNTLEAYNPSPSNSPAISPAWYCLEEEKKWLIRLMMECRDMHIADEKVSLALKQSDTDDSSSNTCKTQDNQQVGSGMDAAKTVQAMTTVPHERNKFIEELCQMFFDIFTDYWRLGTMYLNNLLTLPTTNAKKKNLSENKHTSDEYYALVAEILNTFSDIVRAAFIPHTFSQTKEQKQSDDKMDANKSLLLPWPIQHDAQIISQILPHCLRVCRHDLIILVFEWMVKLMFFFCFFRMCAMQIHSLEIPPPQFETIQNLIYDLRCECLKILLSTPTRGIKFIN